MVHALPNAVCAVLAAAAGLAGCTADSMLLENPASTVGGTLGAGATPDAPAFNPFDDQTSAAVRGREVIRNPTAADIMQPGDLPEMALGRPDAPVTIVKYASLTCPYCRRFQLETFPELKRDYVDTGKVRFILREFPIGFQSGAATIALRCAPPDRYFALYERFLAEQHAWVSQDVRFDPIFRVAAKVGITREQFDACRQNRGMIAALKRIKERGRTLGVIGTPNFFVNGTLVKSVLTMEEIRRMVDPIVGAQGAVRSAQ